MVQAEFRRRTAVHRMNVRPAEGKPGKRYLPCARPMLVWLCSEWGQQKETRGKGVGAAADLLWGVLGLKPGHDVTEIRKSGPFGMDERILMSWGPRGAPLKKLTAGGLETPA